MSDWQFRILTGSASDFAADLNAMIVANGYPAVMPAKWDGQQSVVMPPVGSIRLDFDTFALPSGLHVNARLSALPGADPATVTQDEAFWSGAIAAWFGASNGQPVCPTLAAFTNPQLPALTPPAVQLQVGGQSWKSTGKTVLIPPPPAQKRVWA